MANNLFGSFVRGFGTTLGRTAATSLVNNSSGGSLNYGQNLNPYRITVFQAVFTLFMWFFILLYTSYKTNHAENTKDYDIYAGIMTGWFVFGSFILLLGFKLFNYFTISPKLKRQRTQKLILEQEEKNLLIPKVDSVLIELKNDYPFVDLDFKFNWKENKLTMGLEKLKIWDATLSKLLVQLRELKLQGYDANTMVKILNNELWIGMSEQHMVDMKGVSTKKEIEVLKNGKVVTKHIYGNKISGDVLVFEDGKLVSFKDR
jgi:hypothetical protein